jgi:hypothetical protein
VSIFGENATGKSTPTDALEWFLLGKVEHLWREDCNEAALRDVLLSDKNSSVVSLEFSDTALNSSKTLGPDLKDDWRKQLSVQIISGKGSQRTDISPLGASHGQRQGTQSSRGQVQEDRTRH